MMQLDSIQYRSTPLEHRSGYRVRPFQQEHNLSLGTWIDLLAAEPGFRVKLNQCLEAMPFEAIYWECPPFSSSSADLAGEFVVLESSSLAGRAASPSAFSGYLLAPGGIYDFENLFGDARLVAPAPSSHPRDFGHLLTFLRHAPEHQKDLLWKRVAELAQARRDGIPLWISTAGDGVPWLHVRLDRRPKYIQYDPYRSEDWCIQQA